MVWWVIGGDALEVVEEVVEEELLVVRSSPPCLMPLSSILWTPVTSFHNCWISAGLKPAIKWKEAPLIQQSSYNDLSIIIGLMQTTKVMLPELLICDENQFYVISTIFFLFSNHLSVKDYQLKNSTRNNSIGANIKDQLKKHSKFHLKIKVLDFQQY